MDSKNWWQSKTIWAGAVAALGAFLAITGHQLDPEQMSDLTTDLVDAANAISGIAGIGAVIFHWTSKQTVKPLLAPKA